MTALVYSDVRTFPNNSAIAPYLRVKLTSGVLALAGSTDSELGVMEERALATDLTGAVRLLGPHQTVRAVASVAITANSIVYRAANGKVAATGTSIFGLALGAASGDGSVIEVRPMGDVG